MEKWTGRIKNTHMFKLTYLHTPWILRAMCSYSGWRHEYRIMGRNWLCEGGEATTWLRAERKRIFCGGCWRFQLFGVLTQIWGSLARYAVLYIEYFTACRTDVGHWRANSQTWAEYVPGKGDEATRLPFELMWLWITIFEDWSGRCEVD